eukprot:TRINITY_DN1605_c0_g1_i1.p2 TRINITY_DN1605_c0_g1~~TRINITY_DN1605_c0_g1_i1.p2  ORF type:complete len:102 (-),score=4.99 TRINITY_DN1605_c0_g1_i1:83-388(-)
MLQSVRNSAVNTKIEIWMHMLKKSKKKNMKKKLISLLIKSQFNSFYIYLIKQKRWSGAQLCDTYVTTVTNSKSLSATGSKSTEHQFKMDSKSKKIHKTNKV